MLVPATHPFPPYLSLRCDLDRPKWVKWARVPSEFVHYLPTDLSIIIAHSATHGVRPHFFTVLSSSFLHSPNSSLFLSFLSDRGLPLHFLHSLLLVYHCGLFPSCSFLFVLLDLPLLSFFLSSIFPVLFLATLSYTLLHLSVFLSSLSFIASFSSQIPGLPLLSLLLISLSSLLGYSLRFLP